MGYPQLKQIIHLIIQYNCSSSTEPSKRKALSPIEMNIQQQLPSTLGPNRRRPTTTLVRTLASNALAKKYEYLADKKNINADHTIMKMERERLHAEEEHCLRKECLLLNVQIRKKQLKKLSC